MDQATKELLVARICSGTVRCRLDRPNGSRVYLLKSPTSEQLYRAQELYAERFEDCERSGLYTEAALLDFLIVQDFWTIEQEELLTKLPKEIDEFKVGLFKTGFRSKEKTVIRKALVAARQKLGELSMQRAAYAHLSCSGVASLARSKYLIGVSLYRRSGQPAFAGNFWKHSSSLLDAAMEEVARQKLTEAHYRELARSEPWRSIWSSRTSEGSLFGVPVTRHNEDQHNLVCWSMLYDNVYSHPNAPSDEVIADDDVLDGWLIDQRRQREAAANEGSADELIKNEKIRSSQEVYLVADTVDDARKVESLNSAAATATKRQRFKALKEAGTLNELEMPDTKRRLRMEATQKLAADMAAASK